MKPIIDFIHHLECPTLDGIIFPNGEIQLFDIKVTWGTPNKFNVKTAGRTTVDILKKEHNLYINSCAILSKTVCLKYSVEVIAGEGNYGSDGFIGVLDLASKKLAWLAFFTCSNPFNQIEMIGDEIHAKSTAGCIWRLPLRNPDALYVECFQRNKLRT
jgi:hypothetical protein